MNAPKRKGTTFESALRDSIAALLGRNVHRLALHGGKDIGDLAIEGIDITIEAKALASIDLAGTINELRVEQANRGTRWGAAVFKRRMAPIERSYVVMELDQWCDLVDAAHWRPEPPIQFPKPRLVTDLDRARASHPTGA